MQRGLLTARQVHARFSGQLHVSMDTATQMETDVSGPHVRGEEMKTANGTDVLRGVSEGEGQQREEGGHQVFPF